MIDNSYLYGEGVKVPEIPKEVIEERIRLLNENLATLLAVEWHKRDGARCNAIYKAINFWRNINDN
jgi:hypothetical protein